MWWSARRLRKYLDAIANYREQQASGSNEIGGPRGRTIRITLTDDAVVLAEPELPDGVARLTGRLSFDIETVLLDVATSPDTIDGELMSEVTLYDPVDGVVVRSPTSDRGDDQYLRMRLSHRLGEEAGPQTPEIPADE